jgi:AraC-like DNA-binding protein
MNLSIATSMPLMALNAGLFVARGRGGRHGERVIDSHELIFVQQGRLSMFEGDETFVVEAGQTLLLQAGQRHGGAESYPENLRFYWLHFRLRETGIAADSHLSLPRAATLSEPERLTTLFRRFLDDQAAGTRPTGIMDLTVLQMLHEIAQPANLNASHSAAVLPAQRADEYIRVHAAEPIATSDIAAALGYNPDYLGRVYKQLFGTPLTEAIHRRRIHEAKQLLLDSPQTIDQIATTAGYPDAEYFRRTFRRYEGMTPGAYRRLYARVHVNSE